jgi:hypothetical protein
VKVKAKNYLVMMSIVLVVADDPKELHVAMLVWLAKTKLLNCSSLPSVQKNRQGDVNTFNVAKCDKIFDELLERGNIKLSHTFNVLNVTRYGIKLNLSFALHCGCYYQL